MNAENKSLTNQIAELPADEIQRQLLKQLVLIKEQEVKQTGKLESIRHLLLFLLLLIAIGVLASGYLLNQI